MKGLALGIGETMIDPAVVEKVMSGTDLKIDMFRANSISDAAKVLGTEYPDFVLLSMDPKWSEGLAITRYLVSNLSRIKVIWLSQRKEHALMAYEENVWHFLKLPLDDDGLTVFKRRIQSA